MLLSLNLVGCRLCVYTLSNTYTSACELEILQAFKAWGVHGPQFK